MRDSSFQIPPPLRLDLQDSGSIWLCLCPSRDFSYYPSLNSVPQGCCPPRLFQAYSNIGKIQLAPQGSEPCSPRLLPSKTVPGILQHWEDSTCPPKVVPASSRLTCPTRLDQDVLQEDLTRLSLQDPQETPCPSRATLSPKAGHPNQVPQDQTTKIRPVPSCPVPTMGLEMPTARGVAGSLEHWDTSE